VQGCPLVYQPYLLCFLTSRLRRAEERCRALEIDKEAILASTKAVGGPACSYMSLVYCSAMRHAVL
jgi:hypothetical protein